ncbi:MAG: DUF6489 family protein [Rhodospirillaceae bacterium]
MKVTFDIDCTPEEARRFLGLPDVTPVNEAIVAELTRRAAEMAGNMDAEKMMSQWMTAGVQGIGELQKAFYEQFARAQGAAQGPATPGGKSGARD